MRWLSTCLIALTLVTASGSAGARPPAAPATPPKPSSEKETVLAAMRAWSAGDWTRVRTLLEPLVQGDRSLADELDNEAALRYLADATLQDEATLDAPIRQELATNYIQRLLNSSPDWQPPAEIHSRQFYTLYNGLREQRDRAQFRECFGERSSCEADLQERTAQLTRLQNDHALLKKAFGEQEVEVREKVARNRAVALIPFGVGHFYNGRKGLGAAFLSGELVFGGIGLGLFIARGLNCTRTNGYVRGSLECKGSGNGDAVVARRDAEQTMGLMFLGALALDIVLAQITFRPYLTVKTTRVRRQDLGAEPDATKRRGGKDDKGVKGDKEPRPRSRTRTHDILQAAPAPALIPGGGGLGVILRF